MGQERDRRLRKSLLLPLPLRPRTLQREHPCRCEAVGAGSGAGAGNRARQVGGRWARQPALGPNPAGAIAGVPTRAAPGTGAGAATPTRLPAHPQTTTADATAAADPRRPLRRTRPRSPPLQHSPAACGVAPWRGDNGVRQSGTGHPASPSRFRFWLVLTQRTYGLQHLHLKPSLACTGTSACNALQSPSSWQPTRLPSRWRTS